MLSATSEYSIISSTSGCWKEMCGGVPPLPFNDSGGGVCIKACVLGVLGVSGVCGLVGVRGCGIFSWLSITWRHEADDDEHNEFMGDPPFGGAPARYVNDGDDEDVGDGDDWLLLGCEWKCNCCCWCFEISWVGDNLLSPPTTKLLLQVLVGDLCCCAGVACNARPT